ncbi:hypothetical protein ACI6Q2_23160 [Chitinophagaceae bacterium LWZ2-11]
MKFCFTVFFTSLFLMGYSQTADNIVIKDTRSVDNPPSAYGQNVNFEFKWRNVIGVPGYNNYCGLMTIAPWNDNSGGKHHQLRFNDGGIFYRQGVPLGSWEGWQKLLIENANGGVGIGTTTPQANLHIAQNDGASDAVRASLIFSRYWISNSETRASSIFQYNTGGSDKLVFAVSGDGGSSSSPVDYAMAKMVIQANGNVGVGTTTPAEKLAVNGNIRSKKIIVTQNNWPDYVFDSSYTLTPLALVEQFIKDNKHLPDVPSAKEVADKGLDVGDNQAVLLKKIEELTLYIIELKKEVELVKKIITL